MSSRASFKAKAVWSDEVLVSNLNLRGVRILTGGDAHAPEISDAELACGLVQSADTRLQLATVAWLLKRPADAPMVLAASGTLPPDMAHRLQILGVAAACLQVLMHDDLKFIAETWQPLSTRTHAEADRDLTALAATCARTWMPDVDWRGTFRHMARALMRSHALAAA